MLSFSSVVWLLTSYSHPHMGKQSELNLAAHAQERESGGWEPVGGRVSARKEENQKREIGGR